MKTKKLALFSAAAVTLAIPMTGCTNYKELLTTDQAKYIELAFENTAKQIVKNNKTSAFDDFIKVANGETLEINASSEDFSYSAKLSAKDNFKAFQDLKIKDKAFTVNTTSDKENINFAVKSDHTNGTYFIGLNDISDKLNSSLFAPSSESKYALDEESFNSFKENIINYTENMQDSSKSDLFDNIAVSTETKEITISGETAEADVITYTLSDDFIDGLIYDSLEQSGLDKIYGAKNVEYRQELLEEITSEGTVSFYINAKNHCFMLIDADLKSTVNVSEDESDSWDLSFSANFGADIKKSDNIALNISSVSFSIVSGKQVDNTVLADMILHKLEETDSAVSLKTDMSFNVNGESNSFIIDTLFDKSENKITSSVTDNASKTTYDLISVRLQSSSDRADIFLDEINYYDSDNSKKNLLDGITLELSITNEALPEITNGKELLTLTESEMDTLIQNISDDLSEII